MKRTELQNKFLKHKTDESRQAFVKQRKYCVSLLRKSKRNYYSNLNVKDITDNQKFWKTIKPLFLDKAKLAVSITLKDNNKIVESQNEVANIFNDSFSKIVSSLQIPESNNFDLQSERMSCPKLKSIMKYRRHPALQQYKMHIKEVPFLSVLLERSMLLRNQKLHQKESDSG